ncbi:hypothetical protein HAX54_019672 [Datura stramonium]|uniref:DUF7138 domain-containing protein n=1 Tax=Datura stramonium TaxID=4076 RepID=A0ABS8S219_DATST|nr:hypothetical protein [Datura stramonium]
MVEGGAGPEFEVVFFDGEREMNIGSIRVYPMLEFKAFQLMLSQRIGISPNQISIYMCDRKSSKFEDRRRIPITGKANFGLIACEKDCFFLVVLKRSRKSRNRKTAKSDYGGGFMTENEFPVSTPPDNLILLRRNQPDMNHLGLGSSFYDQISQTELENLNDQLQSLKIQRDNYTTIGMSQLNPTLIHLNNPYPDPFPRIQDTFPTKSKCKHCKGNNGNEKILNFHHCTNDPAIVGGYRSRFGPVRRPVNFN